MLTRLSSRNPFDLRIEAVTGFRSQADGDYRPSGTPFAAEIVNGYLNSSCSVADEGHMPWYGTGG